MFTRYFILSSAGLRKTVARIGQTTVQAGLIAAMCVLGAASTANGQAQSEAIILPVGKAMVLNLPRPASDVLVSEPTIVDTVMRTARQPVLFGMRIGQANVLFFDDAGNQMRSVEIRVEYDTAMLDRMIREQFPDAQVTAESVLGEIILSGQARTSAEAAEIGGLTERFVAASRIASGGEASGGDGDSEMGGLGALGGQATEENTGVGVVNRIAVINEEQIHLRVRVAEVNRNVLKRLGIDWNAGLQATDLFGTANFFGSPLLIGQAHEASLSAELGPQTLDTFIKALEEYSQVRTLAEPSLTAVSGESASFLAGGEFPIPVERDEDGIGIEFKEYGVALDFTPVVIGEGRISLQVATEVSELTDVGAVTVNAFTIPALTVRRANTTLELSSGGTIVMAGLIQQNSRRLSVGLPGLRQVPVLGQLFRSEEFTNLETELVILVTPYTVRQGAPEDFRAPIDGFAAASDVDMYLFGRLHSVYGDGAVGGGAPTKPGLSAQALQAPVGFIVE